MTTMMDVMRRQTKERKARKKLRIETSREPLRKIAAREVKIERPAAAMPMQ